MSSSFRFDDAGHFTAGAIGEPGARVFYLQASEAGEVVSLKLEKQQVAALAEYLATLLADLPTEGSGGGVFQLELIEPVLAEWTVGSIGVAYDEAAGRFVVIVEELVDEEQGVSPAVARFHVTQGQIAAFVPHAEELVGRGRPPCPICGRPMDPDGHACPRSNGHKRPT